MNTVVCIGTNVQYLMLYCYVIGIKTSAFFVYYIMI